MKTHTHTYPHTHTPTRTHARTHAQKKTPADKIITQATHSPKAYNTNKYASKKHTKKKRKNKNLGAGGGGRRCRRTLSLTLCDRRLSFAAASWSFSSSFRSSLCTVLPASEVPYLRVLGPTGKCACRKPPWRKYTTGV